MVFDVACRYRSNRIAVIFQYSAAYVLMFRIHFPDKDIQRIFLWCFVAAHRTYDNRPLGYFKDLISGGAALPLFEDIMPVCVRLVCILARLTRSTWGI